MLKLCGETEERLAQELIQFEFQTERDVVEPLCLIAEVRLPDTSCILTLRALIAPPMFSAGGHPQHPEAEEALSQTGLGHGFCPDEVRDTRGDVRGFYGAEASFSVRVLYRYQQSSKSSSHPSALQPGTKSESLREEMEEAANRMEICRVRHQTQPPPVIYVPSCRFYAQRGPH